MTATSLLSMFRLDGQVAVVTGASKGIGRAISLAFAEAGAKVVLAARTLADLEALADEIRAAGGEAAHPVPRLSGHGQLLVGRSCRHPVRG